MRSRRKYKKAAACLFLLPGLFGVSCFVFVPFADVIVRSFHTSLSGRFIGIKNYVSVLTNTAFRLAVMNTVRFILVGLPLLLFISFVLAFMMYQIPKSEKVKPLFLLPMAVPAATMVLVWKLLFAKQGFLNQMLETNIDLLNEDSAFWILVISYLWKNLGYTMVLWLAGLKTVPQDIIDAAKVDGVSKMKCLIYIILPYLKGSIYTISVLSLLNSFKVFREVYLVSGGYPQEKIYLLQHVFNNWYTNLDIDKMAAGSVMAVIVLGSITVLLQRLWNKEEVC